MRRITDRDGLIAVARAHGTPAAARWAGVTVSAARKARRAHDPQFTRGRGRPNRAEVERAKPRPSCDCPWCADVFSWGRRDRKAEARTRRGTCRSAAIAEQLDAMEEV